MQSLSFFVQQTRSILMKLCYTSDSPENKKLMPSHGTPARRTSKGQHLFLMGTSQATDYFSILLSPDSRQVPGPDLIYFRRPPGFNLPSRPNGRSVPSHAKRRHQAISRNAYFALAAAATTLAFLLAWHRILDTILCILFFLPYPFWFSRLAILVPLICSPPSQTKIVTIFVFVSLHWITRVQSGRRQV